MARSFSSGVMVGCVVCWCMSKKQSEIETKNTKLSYEKEKTNEMKTYENSKTFLRKRISPKNVGAMYENTKEEGMVKLFCFRFVYFLYIFCFRIIAPFVYTSHLPQARHHGTSRHIVCPGRSRGSTKGMYPPSCPTSTHKHTRAHNLHNLTHT